VEDLSSPRIEGYSEATRGSLRAAEEILGILWRIRQFDRVIDVGCGPGAWLRIARKLGAKTVLGLEGFQQQSGSPLIPAGNIRITDLEKPIEIQDRFDLCISVEVAEHLSPERAEGFIREITSLADIVLFSAAIPFQGGHNHLNERWPEYWAELFSRHDFIVWDGVRRQIWTQTQIPWWYRQNILLFLRKDLWSEILDARGPADPKNLSLVHPECFLWRNLNTRTSRAELASYWA
jgi:SAM-dependent methyltransferase